MSFFASRRERRLWLWLVVVLTAIYATLGRAPGIALILREREDLRDSLFFALFVLLVVLAIFFVRRRPGWAEIAVAAGAVIVFVAAWLRMGTLEERTHLFEYGLVAALVHEALLERNESGRRVPAPALLAFVIALGLGWIDEGIQALLPNRVYDIRDVGFNGAAAAMIIGARWALEWVGRRVSRRRS